MWFAKEEKVTGKIVLGIIFEKNRPATKEETQLVTPVKLNLLKPQTMPAEFAEEIDLPPPHRIFGYGNEYHPPNE